MCAEQRLSQTAGNNRRGNMDETRMREFMGRIVNDMGGAAMMASVIVGEELGLYRAMADGAPVTADDLAAQTHCNPRLTREWLNAQAASGYVEYADGRFRLPAEQAMALADEDSPVYVAGGAAVLASMFLDKDKLIQAMRGNGALAWGDHHPCMFSGTERFFRPGYRANLVSSWLPALPGVVAKLEKGARVADVGCGHGAGLSEIEVLRLRLPRAVGPDRRQAGEGCGRRGTRHLRGGSGEGLPGQ